MLPRLSRFVYTTAFLLLYFVLSFNKFHPILLQDYGLPYTYTKTSFNWAAFPQRHLVPVSEMARLPSGQTKNLPVVQHNFQKAPSPSDWKKLTTRRNAVLRAFVKSWNSYKKHAWMWDELAPISGTGKNTFGGLAATLVDALDILWIMGLKDDFYQAVRAVAAIDFMNTTETSLNLFETTIRHLGGLLSAYDLSGEHVLLRKATELGDMLYVAFDTPNRLPGFWLNFQNARDGTQEAGTGDPSAAPCSLSLEFTRLSQLTGNPKYYDAVDRVAAFLERTQYATKLPGMWPTLINFRDETAADHHEFTLGALADSLYEYLPKMHALLGGLEPRYEKLYRGAMAAVEKNLLFRPMTPDNADVLFAGTAIVRPDGRMELNPEGQHLACFVGGMFGLGGKLFGLESHVELGERLARGCGWGYKSFPTGILPEIFGLLPCDSLDGCQWDEEKWLAEGDRNLAKGFKQARDPRYLLRPEAIESLFLLYRMTGKAEFREMAWAMFESIQKATETTYAFAAITDVKAPGETEKMDSMESFWPSETLKYFYLMFSPSDLVSLDEYVFNTEAHPLKRS